MNKFLFIVLALFIVISCGEESMSSTEENFLIIGLTFGECGGDCSFLYKLEDGKLFEDTEETWWNSAEDPSFNSSPMNNDIALAEIKDLEAEFPDYLVETDEVIFGCPDCGDWGAIHVFNIIDGERKYWTLDNALESNPEEIQAWTKRVQDLIFELSN